MNTNPLLSIVVISHNQRDLLKRCLDSVLEQKTNFPVEIIVSDDRSMDGTLEMVKKDYPTVKYTWCNSDEISPSFTLQRAAYNRLNGLKLATGKYLIHIDGDDFFIGKDTFQRQVDVLERHPECTMCVQNYRKYQHGQPLNTISEPKQSSLPSENLFIMECELFIRTIGYIPNACFCMRRENVDTNRFTTKTYDDNDIEYQYMGDGKIATINAANFVYVQYGDRSISDTMPIADKQILYMAGINAIQIAPQFAGAFVRITYRGMVQIAKKIVSKHRFSNELVDYMSGSKMFIYRACNNKFQFADRCRAFLICILGYMMRYLNIHNKYAIRIMYKLAIDWNIALDVHID